MRARLLEQSPSSGPAVDADACALLINLGAADERLGPWSDPATVPYRYWYYSVLINSSRPEHTKRTQGNAEQRKRSLVRSGTTTKYTVLREVQTLFIADFGF